jgi:hypothetical protein
VPRSASPSQIADPEEQLEAKLLDRTIPQMVKRELGRSHYSMRHFKAGMVAAVKKSDRALIPMDATALRYQLLNAIGG